MRGKWAKRGKKGAISTRLCMRDFVTIAATFRRLKKDIEELSKTKMQEALRNEF